MSEEFIIVQDEDCHWYLIPESQESNWHAFCESDDYGFEDLPKWAKEIDSPRDIIIMYHRER